MRRTVFTAALIAAVIMGDSALYAAMPAHSSQMGLTVIEVGILLSANRWIRLVTNTMSNRLGERWGWSRLFTASLWLAAGSTTAYATANAFGVLLLARMVWGWSFSGLQLSRLRSVMAESHSDTRGRLAGLANSIVRIGSLPAVFGVGFLVEWIGFSKAFALFAIIAGMGALVATVAGIRGVNPVPNHDHHSIPPEIGERLSPSSRFRPVRMHYATWWAAFCTRLTVDGVLTATIGFLVLDRFGLLISTWGMTLGAVAFTGVMLSGRFLSDLGFARPLGYVADRYGRWRVISVAVILCMVGLVGVVTSQTPLVMLAFVVVVWLARTSLGASLDAMAVDLAHRTAGQGLSIYTTAADLGAAIGPVIAAVLAQYAMLSSAYWGSAGLMASILIVYGLARRPDRNVKVSTVL